MTSSVETKEGGVNNFIYASIIGVYVPGRNQSCFILRLFSFFVLNNIPFLSVQSITAYAFSRWMNFAFLVCAREIEITSASAGRLFGVQTACLLARSKYRKNEKQPEG